MDILDFTKLKIKPDITARFNLPQDKLRIYVHGNPFAFGSPFNARDHVLKTFMDLKLRERSDYLIVVPWMDGENRMVDFFNYSLENFPKNEESPSIYTKNGKIINNGHCCLDSRLICGAEEFYRRTCNSPEEYINNPPRIKGLDLKLDSESSH